MVANTLTATLHQEADMADPLRLPGQPTIGRRAPMIMGPQLRKFVLTAHIASSVSLLGAVAGFLVLALTGLVSQDAEIVRACYLAMPLIAWLVIVPLAFASLLIGIAQSLGTPWGLFRHWWVLLKLLVTVFATTVLLLKMQLIDTVAGIAAETALSTTDLRDARLQLAVHAGAGLMVLLVPMVLSVYKPTGMTRYGWRKQQERHSI
jgi:hypothetical protein